jgi:L-asparaginase
MENRDIGLVDTPRIKIISTGGTIDKIYFDQNSEYEVGEPQAIHVLQEANVGYVYELTALMRKDSLDLTDQDRSLIRDTVINDPNRHIVITHGTDGMVETGRCLAGIPGKVVVLTGAMQPASLRQTDAVYNIGCAMTAVQLLPDGVYIAMNGRIFDPAKTRKNARLHRFEESE